MSKRSLFPDSRLKLFWVKWCIKGVNLNVRVVRTSKNPPTSIQGLIDTQRGEPRTWIIPKLDRRGRIWKRGDSSDGPKLLVT